MSGPESGSFVGNYQLLNEVGQGGNSRIFRARHVHPAYADRAFALKILNREAMSSPVVQARFRREAYLLSLLGITAVRRNPAHTVPELRQ